MSNEPQANRRLIEDKYVVYHFISEEGKSLWSVYDDKTLVASFSTYAKARDKITEMRNEGV